MGIVAVIAVAAVMVLFAAGVGAVAAMLGVGPPRLGIPAPSQQTVTGWPWGQCTWYVALRRAEIGEPVTWSGDAWQWLEHAAAQGVAEAVTPAPGEIAVYQRGGTYDSRYGHVAFVIAADATAYTIAEANFYGFGVIDTRTVPWPDAQIAGFIR